MRHSDNCLRLTYLDLGPPVPVGTLGDEILHCWQLLATIVATLHVAHIPFRSSLNVISSSAGL